ncbi:MAG: hypothetical protein JSW52_08830 [Candidatus Coatesbacteria bacterium]|nr:MAG: hypothetical protein JSW52_08830 [Candidatus Coatesbacteria bacterium]
MPKKEADETLEEKLFKKAEAPKAGDKEIEEGKTFAGIGYLGILFLVPLLAAKDNKFAKFHGKQGMVLCCAGIACSVAAVILLVLLTVVFGVLGFVIPGPLSCVGSALGTIIGLVIWIIVFGGWLVLTIMGLINAFSGKYWKMPLLGGLAEKINI